MLTTPQQIFDAMPASFRPEKAGPVELSLQFELKGEAGGEWGVEIASGACRTWAGQVEYPVATIRSSDDDIVAIFNGSLNAVAAYMSGRVQVDGDVTAIMNLLSFFDMPRG
jgi:putative sterol carrier protein